MLWPLLRSYSIIVAVMLMNVTARAQLVANFTVDKPTVCQGGTVAATSTSTGVTAQTTYQWSVDCAGWGITGQGSVAATYQVGTPNTCTITLTVTDGSLTSSATQTVHVLARPVASFTSDIQTVCIGGCVSFTDQSTSDQSGGPNEIHGWQWIFDGGDPSGSTVSGPTSCYDYLGDYDVYLGVIDAFGCSSSQPVLTNYVHVTDAIPLTPTFTSACTPPLTGTFSANAPAPWSWTFPNGTVPTSSTVENPTVTFGSAGTHNVTLTAGGPGCESTVTFPVTVTASPTISFDLPSNACVGEVELLNVSDASGWSWTVDPPASFVSPTSSSSQFPRLLFSTPDQYTVKLDATLPGGCAGTVSHTITIGDELTVDFSADTLEGCSAPFLANFTPNVTGAATSYSWNFGQGSPFSSTDLDPGQVSFPFGCNTVSLTVGNGGCSVTETKPGYICVLSPVVGIAIQHLYNRCLPLTVPFYDTTQHQVPVVSWEWNFGDGHVETSQNPDPTHVYDSAGVFWASLTITNATGCTATSNQIMIRVDDLPAPDFEVSDTLVCPGEIVCFTNLSTDTVDVPLWQWNFHDNNWFGGGSNARDPCYAFVDSGYHDICLTVNNNGCEKILCYDDLVRVHPPVLNFSITRSCENTTEIFVQIHSESGPPFPNVDDDYYWNFNDGSLPVIGEPSYTYTYSQQGMNQICLYSSNDSLGCSNSRCKEVELYNPVPAFTPSKTETCPGTICFTDFPDYGVDMLGWDFGDGSPIEWMDPWMAQWYGVCHYYTNPGYYDVMLIVEISGIDSCYDTLLVADLIHIMGVGQSADFSYAPISVCDNQNFGFQFTDESPAGEVSSWSWDFGDLGTSNDMSPAHHYQDWTGQDLVTLTITDMDGCSSEITRLVTEPPAPEAEIIVSASVACQGEVVQFAALPSDPSQIQSYWWNFGDGTTSAVQNPEHAYSHNDTFDVFVMTTSISGCVDTTWLLSAVIVDDPVADFSATVDFTFCPQVFVTFTNHSSGNLNSYILEHGDETNRPNAFYPGNTETKMYNPFDIYDAVLIATNPAGCTDSDTITNVLDPYAALGPFHVSVLDTADCAPFDIEFTAFNKDDSCYTYNWDFGDGSPVLGNGGTVVQHTYQEAGTHWIKLVMTNCINFQCVYEDSMQVTVAPLFLDVSPELTICFGDSIQLHALLQVQDADTNGYQYEWNNESYLTSSSVQNPLAFPVATTTFAVTGKYSDCSITDSVTVTVNQLPIITQTPFTAVCDGDAPFALSGADPVGGFYTGDNVQGGIFSPETALPGCDTIVYEYTDNNGCMNTDTNCITVHPLPVVAFVHIDSLCNDAQPYVLTQASPAGGDYSGIGVYGTDTFYPDSVAPGTYPIAYTFTDVNGCISIPTQSITVNPNPVNGFTMEDHCFSDTMQISNTSSILTGTVQSSTWTYSDGHTDNTFTPSAHLFEAAGTYSVQLISVSEHGCSDSLTQTITVHPLPKADFSVAPICFTHPSVFQDLSHVSAGSIDHWEWTFPDFPLSSTVQDPSHLFLSDGSLPVFLRVETDFGCTDTVTRNAIVHPLPILSIEHEDRCFGEDIQLSGLSFIAEGTIDLYTWDLGDGTLSGLTDVVHLYSEPGFYDVQFSAFTDKGCSDSVQTVVEVFELPQAGFFAFPDVEGCEPFMVTFIDTSSIPLPYHIATWAWDFGNGATATEQQPTLVYDTAGTYDVELTVTSYNGCVDSVKTDDYIIVRGRPRAGFIFSPDHISGFFPAVTFSDQSTGAIAWHWEFGDDRFSEEQHPIHVYADTGDYRVIQIVANEFQCVDTAEKTLTVWPEPTFYIPNAFTPNNDGINETFAGKGYGIRELTMQIFDRWGEEVFFTNDMNAAWDGTYRNKPVEQGVYIYRVSVIFIRGEYQEYIGHVNLTR